MRIARHISELIGNTPLVRLHSVVPTGAGAVAAKVEYLNPGGGQGPHRGQDDRRRRGERGLKPGGTIVEPTSGNTGVGLAIVAQRRGYHCVFVCPDKVSEDKRNVLRAYGAEVVVCPTAVAPDHPDSYYSVSDRLAREIQGPGSPTSTPTPTARPATTRRRARDLGGDRGQVTHFVAGVGTGGTISGVGRYLKECGRAGRVIGADPEGSVYSGGAGRPYLVEGVGEDFWPAPTTRRARRDHRGDRRRLLRHDAAAGPRGGTAGRWLVRDGRGGGAAGGRAAGRDAGRGVAARRGPRVPVEDVQRRWMASYGFCPRPTAGRTASAT